LTDVQEKGGEVVAPEEGAIFDPVTRRMPLTLALGVTDAMRVAQEEIFGPILPVFVYDDLSEVIDRLHCSDKPLTMTIFSHNQADIDRLIENTISGGVSVNGASLHTAVISLGFGGVGASGMGRHHGVEGFREFSSPRAMFVRGPEDHAEIIFPPYGEAAALAVAAMFPNSEPTAPV
jgi:coniferyl-aldehyde dehydrogenase